MLNTNLEKLHQSFNSLSNTDTESDIEFWYARKLQEHLGYAGWENFVTAINRAVDSCKSSGINHLDHFREVTKMISLGKGGKRNIDDFYFLFNLF